MAMRLDYLAKRIPFKLEFHLAAGGCHSSRYRCKQLNISAEKHVHGKTGADGYFDPNGKVTTSVYRDDVEADDFLNVVMLLRSCPEVARRARELFGAKKR